MRSSLLFFLFLFASICAIALYLHSSDIAYSQDLGRHILTGSIIVKEHIVPKTNLFSYTYPDFPFINHHWLSEVAYYTVVTNLGTNALIILSTLLVACALCILVYENKNQHFLAILISLFLYSNILRERVDLRPEIFSYFFLTVFITLLYRFKDKYTKLIFLLIPLQLLWTNMHIYFPIGLAIIGLFLLDAFIFSTTSRKYKQTLIGVFVGQLLVSTINPNGIHGLLYPFTVFSNYGYTIEENQNILFLWNYSQKIAIVWLVLSFLLGVGSLFLSTRKVKILDICIYAFFSFLAMQAIRNFPLFVFGTFFIFVSSLSGVINRYFSKYIDHVGSYFLGRIVFVIVCIGVLLHVLVYLPKIPIGFEQDLATKPGVDFFIANNLPTPIFNNFDIGSYLEYRLYPSIRVFVDGRPEAYPKDFFKNTYVPMQENSEIFNNIDAQYSFNTILVSHADQAPWSKSFLQNLSKDEKWQLIYLDDFIIMYVKKSPANTLLLDKYKNPVIIYNSKKLLSLYRMVVVSELIGDTSLLEKLSKDLLILDPKNCYALGYFAQNSEDTADKTVKTAQYLDLCR